MTVLDLNDHKPANCSVDIFAKRMRCLKGNPFSSICAFYRHALAFGLRPQYFEHLIPVSDKVNDAVDCTYSAKPKIFCRMHFEIYIALAKSK